jgi:hypothetical protein
MKIKPGTLYWYQDTVVMYLLTEPKELGDDRKYKHAFLLSDGDIGWGYTKAQNFEREFGDVKRIEL